MNTEYDAQLPAWLTPLRSAVRQSPLIDTRLSLPELEPTVLDPAPAAIFVGIGLCSEHRLSQAVPIDVLAPLLAAEQLRRALCIPKTVVLVADRHALSNAFSADHVDERSRQVLGILQRLKAAFLGSHLSYVLASELHHLAEYRDILRETQRTTQYQYHPYVSMQLADTEYFRRAAGNLIKVGWAFRTPTGRNRRRDERFFDTLYKRTFAHRPVFCYARPGRVLDDERPLGPPYVAVNSKRRICLSPKENVGQKLRYHAPDLREDTLAGIVKQLRAITRVYTQLAGDLSGSVEDRTQQIIDTLFAQPASNERTHSISRESRLSQLTEFASSAVP